MAKALGLDVANVVLSLQQVLTWGKALELMCLSDVRRGREPVDRLVDCDVRAQRRLCVLRSVEAREQSVDGYFSACTTH